MADLPKRTSVSAETLARWSKGTFFPGEMIVCVEMLQGALTDVALLQRELFACQRQTQAIRLAADRLATATLVGPDEARKARSELLTLLDVDNPPNSGQHKAYEPPENRT